MRYSSDGVTEITVAVRKPWMTGALSSQVGGLAYARGAGEGVHGEKKAWRAGQAAAGGPSCRPPLGVIWPKTSKTVIGKMSPRLPPEGCRQVYTGQRQLEE
ncbi:hypothetical protein GCM10010140_38880 [Streptosporangium pseudovulgare]|uniref:Uncharacterized protein n=1 Tax=Streptosporangium pseudovulgare TaxID=35765 RepID=A0ABQ2R0E5_9ACTN|nr:hypothetical protein GCM10010140_38880 [Streptosporangium pseudovulgare]